VAAVPPSWRRVRRIIFGLFGHTPNGAQRYRCKTCGQTLTETRGTLFYRRRTPRPERVVEHIGIAVQRLRVARLRHNGVRLHEAHERGVVVARPVVQQPRVPVQPLPGAVAVGC